MEAINQLFFTWALVLLVIGWLGIALALSGLAIFVYRLVRMILKGYL